MIPVICIVGAKKTGKTVLMEKLIPELRARGYLIGTVKHDVHDFSIDQEGKDTWRHRKAGSQTVAISSPSQVAIIKAVSRELSLPEIVQRFFWEEDLIIAEGYKASPFPKIEVLKKDKNLLPLCGPADHLIATYGDLPEKSDVPHFDHDSVKDLADFIESRYLKTRKGRLLSVVADGKNIPLNDFVETIVGNTLEGLLKSLKGWEDPSQVTITLLKRKAADKA